jgi:hypothetical protein
MTTQKRFDYVFEEEGPSGLTYETSPELLERAELRVEEGTGVLYVNRDAAEVLARILAKLARGAYEGGFHLHLPRNLNSDEPETLRLVLTD